MHKLLFAVAALSFSLAGFSLAGLAHAADNPQQNKMATCNKTATEKGLKGDDRKKFMAECLKAAPTAPAPAPAAPPPAAPPAGGKVLAPKDAMGACAKKSKELGNKGDAHKEYMSKCLKAKGPDNVK